MKNNIYVLLVILIILIILIMLFIKISKRINSIKDLIKFDLSPVTKTEKGTKIKNKLE